MAIQPQNIKFKESELHSSLCSILHYYRWFGFFPIEGLGQNDPYKVRFNLKSWYSIYYILSSVGQLFLTTISFIWFLDKYMTLGTLSNCVFYGSILITTTCLIKLAKHWPRLLCKATKIEMSLADIRMSKNVPRKCYIMANFVMFLALVELILSKVFNVKLIMSCMGESTLNTLVLQKYFQHRYYYVFDYMPLNPMTAVIVELTSLQAAFVWSFGDVLIMCISIYLTSYFNDLNEAIKSHQKRGVVPWSKLRVQYADLVIILKQIDSQLSSVLMMSFFSNLFFLCFQLFNSLHGSKSPDDFCDPDGMERAIPSAECLAFYLFSFSFLVVRAMSLSFLAANVHKTAQGPLVALYEVPTSFYDIEVERFQLQLRYTTIGLSGLFFYVTRKTILRVIGTVVTYELIMLQFNMNSTLLY